MASVTVRGCALCIVSLLNLMFVFVSGADLVRFLSFRAIYHNITGETKICRGKLDRLTHVGQLCNGSCVEVYDGDILYQLIPAMLLLRAVARPG